MLPALQVSPSGQCGTRSLPSIATCCHLTKQTKSSLPEEPQISWLILMRGAMRSTPVYLPIDFLAKHACMCSAILSVILGWIFIFFKALIRDFRRQELHRDLRVKSFPTVPFLPKSYHSSPLNPKTKPLKVRKYGIAT